MVFGFFIFIFYLIFLMNCLENADYQNRELNTWGTVLRMSAETPSSAGHCVSEVGKSPSIFLKVALTSFGFQKQGAK